MKIKVRKTFIQSGNKKYKNKMNEKITNIPCYATKRFDENDLGRFPSYYSKKEGTGSYR
jgi:hypothetical protein